LKKSKKNKAKHNIQVVTGTVIGHPKGFGFVERDDKDNDDIYLPVHEMNTVLHGDRVKVEIKLKRKENKLSGKVIKIISRAHKRISGVVRSENRKMFVQPLDKRISHDLHLDKSSLQELNVGDIIEVEVTQYPDHGRKLLSGNLVQIFGDVSDAQMPVTLALYKHQIPYVWSESAQAAEDRCPQKVVDHDLEKRKDLRDLKFVTIDGETAKDFDDAIFVNKTDNGYTLYVAIADVSHYIKPNSVLDKIAYERGTSVYFPNRVVPMLPEAYSNGICSLKPDVDRVVMVCEISLDKQGNRQNYEFYEAVIRSSARLTYTKVWNYLSKSTAHEDIAPAQKTIDFAHELFQELLKLRQQRGALELEIPEAFVNFDQDNKVQSIEPIRRNAAHKLIEEFMLKANVCAAELIDESFEEGMFRIHEKPDDERIADLRYFLTEFALELPGGDRPTSEDFVIVLNDSKVRDEWKYIISTMMLRTQKQARYSEQAGIHFALNYEAYTHFTSPIRRYPDLVVHRLLKCIVKKRKAGKNLLDNLSSIAEHCSNTERRAEDASREVISFYKLQYLQAHVGDTFAGVITGVSNFGFFVELEDIFTSGLVHVTSLLDDFYNYDPLKQQLIGERSAKIFKIGQKIEVQINRVDLEDKKLDLILPHQHPSKDKFTKSRNKKRKKPNG